MSTPTYDWECILGDIAWLLGTLPNESNPHVRTPINSQALADWLKVPRKTMIGWKDGTQPRHADGEMLLAHWGRLAGKSRDFAPKTFAVLPSAKFK